MISRVPDWRLRLDAYLTSRLYMPFGWGVNDCALFAAGDVEALTGHDPASSLRGHCSALQAARFVRGSGGLAAIATAALGHPVRADEARQGDIVRMPQGAFDMLAVCIDDNVVAAPMHEGMGLLPRNLALQAWSVG